MNQKQFQRAIDESLSSIEYTKKDVQAVLRRVRGEPVMKRKLSVALVFALLAVLLVGAAVALYSWRDTGRDIIETEQEEGYFPDWPVEKKVELATAIVEAGQVGKSQEVERMLAGALTEEQAERVADAVLETFTGKEIYEISFMEIMAAAWGPFTEWSFDEQAWYSQLMAEMNLQQEDHTLYVMPGGPVDEAGAIEIARREIARAFGAAEDALAGYPVSTSFQVPEFAGPDDTQPYWQVEFSNPEDLPREDRLFPNTMWAFIHPETGALGKPLDELVIPFREQLQYEEAIQLQNELAQDLQASYPSCEEMYAFRLRWEPGLERIRALSAEDGTYFSFGTLRLMAQVLTEIGMPQAGDLSPVEALVSAKQTLAAQLGWSQEKIELLGIWGEVYLTPADYGKPVYQFVLGRRARTEAEMRGGEASDVYDQYRDAFIAAFGGHPAREMRCVSVRVDARTGEALEEPEVILPPEDGPAERDEYNVLVRE